MDDQATITPREEVAPTQYQDVPDACALTGRFLDVVYQHTRIHSALGYLRPTEFWAANYAHLPTPAAIPRRRTLECPAPGSAVHPSGVHHCRSPSTLTGGLFSLAARCSRITLGAPGQRLAA